MKSDTVRRFSMALAVVILLLVVTSPITAVWLIKKQANRIVDNDLRALTTSSLASMNVTEGFLRTADAVREEGGNLSEIIVLLDQSTKNVDAQYEAHRQTLQNPSDIEKFDYLLKCRQEYRETRNRIFRLLAEGKTREARMLFADECEPRYEVYADALGVVVQNNVLKARDSGKRIITLCNWLLVVQGVLLGFFFIYGFFVPLTAFMEKVTRKPVVFEE